MQVEKYLPMTPTRPCCYCLSLQGDSVFADFNTDDEGRVYLCRISFDGFGCCRVNARRPMNGEDSKNFIGWIEANNVNHDAMRQLLSAYFNKIKELVWADALVDHELL